MNKDREFVTVGLSARYRILAVDADEQALSLYRDVLLYEWEDPRTLEAAAAGQELPEPRAEAPTFELTMCATAEEAVTAVRAAQAERQPYSVALVDVRLGVGLDGVWAAERIRELDQSIEIVIITAQADVSLRELNHRIPPPDKLLYLQKPFRSQELRQLANSLCAKWRAENLLVELNATLLDLVEDRTAELNEANQQLKEDIAARKRMLAELQTNEERYRLLFEEDITGNFVADPAGRIIACNEAFARIFGFGSVEEAKSFNVLNMDFDSLRKDSLLDGVLEQKKIHNFEAVFSHPDLSAVQVIGNFDGVFDDEGNLIEIRGYFFDITERKKLEEQLRFAQKMEALGTLAGGIAHDFGNILGVIMGYAEIILEGAPEKSGLKRRAREIVRASSRARELVDQILNFSRQGPQERKPLKVAPLVKETIKLLRASMPEGIEVKTSILTSEDMVTADPTQLHQILLNLCTNAIHAMREQGGRLEVSLAEATIDAAAASQHPDLTEGTYIRLTVSDTGHGMDPAVMQRIFDPFFTTKKPGEGTGMGLAVVHGIVKRHGGAILVQSEPGKGSTFHVFLPKTEPLDETGLDEEPLFIPGQGKVLFVDDEKAMMDLGKDMLEGLGFTVTGRTSSVEALEAFRYRPEDFVLVIADQSMPNMTGVELAREIQRLRPGMPLILCMGFSETVAFDKAKAMGVKDFLMKPLLRRQLVASLNRLLYKR